MFAVNASLQMVVSSNGVDRLYVVDALNLVLVRAGPKLRE